MKITLYTVVLLLIPLAYAQEQRNPEEAHIYWKNKVTNNNSGETTAEFSSHSEVGTTISLDKESHDQLKQQLIEALKNDAEFKKQLIKELLNDPTFKELLTHALTPQGTFIRFGM